VVHPSFPAKTVPEFIAYAKANPGKVTMASPGNGSHPHVSGELFKMMAGIDMIHVPYRGGGQVMTDLIAGQVQVSFIGLTVAIEHIRGGKLRALATAPTRSDLLPDITSVSDFVPGYVSDLAACLALAVTVVEEQDRPGLQAFAHRELNRFIAERIAEKETR
jgi:tripartite-type tricarboxylate transporter receptor subunit TctC